MLTYNKDLRVKEIFLETAPRNVQYITRTESKTRITNKLKLKPWRNKYNIRGSWQNPTDY